MEAKELRLGNYLMYAGSECFFKVTIEDLKIIEDGSNCRAIPITEEWLIKFGFEISEDSYSDNLGNHICSHKEALFGENPITYDYMIILKNLGDGWFYKNSHHKINYVHELQNLYFSLTKSEICLDA